MECLLHFGESYLLEEFRTKMFLDKSACVAGKRVLWEKLTSHPALPHPVHTIGPKSDWDGSVTTAHTEEDYFFSGLIKKIMDYLS